jgi:hypothetical protein
MEHTGPFQMVTGLYTDAVNGTILARLEGQETSVSRGFHYMSVACLHVALNRRPGVRCMFNPLFSI